MGTRPEFQEIGHFDYSREKTAENAVLRDGPYLANNTIVLAQWSDVVFRTLDGHDFEFDGGACHVEVYGIYDDGDHRWVQLALDGDRQQMLTLRIKAKDKPVCTLVSLALGLAPA